MRPLVLVLGAPPGPLLDARMDTACALVRLKKAEKVIVSGLPLEIPTMAARARTCVGEEDLLVDDGAQRTFDSLVRARDRFGARSLLVVTQAFHMDRALYLARALGLEADGVLAGGPPPGLRTRLRERAARVRARVDVALLSMR